MFIYVSSEILTASSGDIFTVLTLRQVPGEFNESLEDRSTYVVMKLTWLRMILMNPKHVPMLLSCMGGKPLKSLTGPDKSKDLE